MQNSDVYMYFSKGLVLTKETGHDLDLPLLQDKRINPDDESGYDESLGTQHRSQIQTAQLLLLPNHATLTTECHESETKFHLEYRHEVPTK